MRNGRAGGRAAGGRAAGGRARPRREGRRALTHSCEEGRLRVRQVRGHERRVGVRDLRDALRRGVEAILVREDERDVIEDGRVAAVDALDDLRALRGEEREGVVGQRKDVEREADLARAVVVEHAQHGRPRAAAVGAEQVEEALDHHGRADRAPPEAGVRVRQGHGLRRGERGERGGGRLRGGRASGACERRQWLVSSHTSEGASAER